MRAILFLKGNPNHDARGRFARAPSDQRGGGAPPALPPSSGIANAADARAYWREHIADRTVSLHVKTKNRTAAVTVRFDDSNTHMWTRRAGPGDQIDAYDQEKARKGPRTFARDRAAIMDRLFRAISEPWQVLQEHRDARREIYLASPPLNAAGDTYVVVLSVDGPGRLSFASARPRTKDQIRDLMQRARPIQADGGALLKSQTPELSAPGFQPSFLIAAPSGRAPLPGPGASPAEAGPRSQAVESFGAFFAFFKALGPGERWITVHPHGKDQKGVPVLIRPAGDGAYQVVGGAGGKLNFLKLTGVKDAADYKAEAAKRATARREFQKERIAEDK
ncbi:hypothetical protein [Neoroseomonas rubea]|uniref:hypothetical protein n=1 Tax=Neoroseomonas rubea TaxID=2748666 RepID=UPI0018DF8C6B|nr:hypothetical protein [Roseomonas rubea]